MKRLLLLILVSTISSLLYSQVKIEMKKEGGVYKIPCEVNGLKLQFVFDTGASTVSLSSSVAEFMLAHDYLKKEDIIGTVKMRQADGTTYDAYKVKLRTINIGGYVLHDVLGVITKNQNAPLLLGQTALEKLGKISVKDNYFYIEKDKPLEYRGAEKDITFLGLNQSSTYDECYDKLCERYGENKVSQGTNNGQPSITVERMFFNDDLYDSIELLFEDDYLNSVQLSIHYPKDRKIQAKKKADEIYRKYAKKYTSIKKRTYPNGLTFYFVGYENRNNVKDYIKYPIAIEVITSVFRDLVDDEWEIDEYYDVCVTYWPYSQKLLMENHPAPKDEY